MLCQNECRESGAADTDRNRRGRPRSLGRARDQAGFSLTESLAALMLTTVVVLGVAAGIITTVTATESVSRTQKVEAELSDATEYIKALPYLPCAGIVAGTARYELPSQYRRPGDPDPVVRYLSGVVTTGPLSFGSTCSAGDPAQRITIVIDGRSADVVKRNPDQAPA